MTRIEWQESFCTGIPGIDHEHRQLVEALNQIFDLIEANADKTYILERMGDVYGSISSHFALEEELMRRYNYDQLSEHVSDHHRLLDEIQAITQEYDRQPATNTDTFTRKLADWFQIHFSTFDARLHQENFMLEEVPLQENSLSRLNYCFKSVVRRVLR